MEPTVSQSQAASRVRALCCVVPAVCWSIGSARLSVQRREEAHSSMSVMLDIMRVVIEV